MWNRLHDCLSLDMLAIKRRALRTEVRRLELHAQRGSGAFQTDFLVSPSQGSHLQSGNVLPLSTSQGNVGSSMPFIPSWKGSLHEKEASYFLHLLWGSRYLYAIIAMIE